MLLYFLKKLIEKMNYRHSCFYKNKLLFAMDGEQKTLQFLAYLTNIRLDL